MSCAVPISAYLVYDSFECNATITIIFKRLQAVQGIQDSNHWLPLATNFLMDASERYSTTRKEQSAKNDSAHFTGFPLEEAITWKEQHLAFLFSHIFGAHTKVNNTTSIKNSTQSTTSTTPSNKDWTPAPHIAALVKAIKEETTSSSQSSLTVPTTFDKDTQKLDSSHHVGIDYIPFKNSWQCADLLLGKKRTNSLETTCRQAIVPHQQAVHHLQIPVPKHPTPTSHQSQRDCQHIGRI